MHDCLNSCVVAGYRVGGRHQDKDKTESVAAGQRHDEVPLAEHAAVVTGCCLWSI